MGSPQPQTHPFLSPRLQFRNGRQPHAVISLPALPWPRQGPLSTSPSSCASAPAERLDPVQPRTPSPTAVGPGASDHWTRAPNPILRVCLPGPPCPGSLENTAQQGALGLLPHQGGQPGEWRLGGESRSRVPSPGHPQCDPRAPGPLVRRGMGEVAIQSPLPWPSGPLSPQAPSAESARCPPGPGGARAPASRGRSRQGLRFCMEHAGACEGQYLPHRLTQGHALQSSGRRRRFQPRWHPRSSADAQRDWEVGV